MEFPFDSSCSNKSHLGSHLGLNDQTMNHNHALFNSHKTELISQHPTRPTVGQLGLKRSLVNEVRSSTSLIPQRVQVVQSVNVNYFPVQNQTSLATFGDRQEFSVAKVGRTQLLNSASTRERFLAPNHGCYGASTSSQGQANTTTEAQSFLKPTYRVGQCFNASKSSSSTRFPNPRSNPNSSHQYVPNLGLNQNPPSTRKQSTTLRLIENDESTTVEVELVNLVSPTRTKNPSRTQNQVPSNDDDELQNLHDHQDHNIVFKEGHDHEEDGDIMKENDGITHSLPYKKYGPYTCPKCKRVFSTSQFFAAHMGSHYKYESSEQRRKRFLAKYGRKKHYRLVNSKDGFTVVFDQPFKKTLLGAEKKANNNGHKKNNSEEVEEKKESEHEMVVARFQLEGLVDVPVKKEPLDIIN